MGDRDQLRRASAQHALAAKPVDRPVARDRDDPRRRIAKFWSEAFGGTRAHIGYRMLYRYGLIRIFRPAGRRDDGTIEDFHERDPEDMPHGPLHFIVDLDTPQEDALTQVVPAVTAATISSLDEAWAESQGMTF